MEFIHTVSARAKVKYCDYINHKLRTYFSILTGISQQRLAAVTSEGTLKIFLALFLFLFAFRRLLL